ncbi:MAG: hypothetical protein H7X79_00130 [Sporomusaceae bacterium]|nr:hypothetical protein [Sporomusaceae bacterium]
MKEQYVQAIKTIMLQFTPDIGDDASLTTAAEAILDTGLSHIRQFSENPGSEAILTAITKLGNADTYIDKVIAIMSLAFALGTMKIETDVSIRFFDELLYLLFTKDFEELTAMKAMMASMYETADHNSPY